MPSAPSPHTICHPSGHQVYGPHPPPPALASNVFFCERLTPTFEQVPFFSSVDVDFMPNTKTKTKMKTSVDGPLILCVAHKWSRVWDYSGCDPMGHPINKEGGISHHL